MAFAQTNDVIGTTFFARLNAVVANVRLAAEKHKVYVQTFDALNALSDAELDDIGLGRGQIAEIARAEAAKLG